MKSLLHAWAYGQSYCKLLKLIDTRKQWKDTKDWIKVITQMKDSADNVKVLVLLFQRTICQAIPTVGKRQYWIYVCHWYQKENCLLEERSSNKTMSYTKGPKKRLSRNGVYSFQMFWCIMNSPSLLKSPREENSENSSVMKWFCGQKEVTQWSEQNNDYVSKESCSHIAQACLFKWRRRVVFNLINRQRKLVVMNHHCSYVLKKNTLVIMSKGRLSTRIQY